MTGVQTCALPIFEGYDLSKSIARADLCNDIEEALLTFKDVEDD